MSQKRILIVEDNLELIHVLTTLFRGHGYAVVSAADAASAVREALKTKPDLILLDLGLPGGDGFVVMERVKALIPLTAVPIVILSALDTDENEQRARQQGATAFLRKPFDNKSLLEAVQRALGESQDAAPEPAGVSKENKILIVDDNLEFLKVLNTLFKNNGYTVFLASDAISCMSLARKTRPDVVLLDLGLPGGDGFVVMDRLRSQVDLMDIPIIVLTALDTAENEKRARDAGVAHFLRKPIDNDELLRVVKSVLS